MFKKTELQKLMKKKDRFQSFLRYKMEAMDSGGNFLSNGLFSLSLSLFSQVADPIASRESMRKKREIANPA